MVAQYIKSLYFYYKNKIISNYLTKKYQGKLTVKQTTINNLDILVFLNDSVGRQIYGLGKYELDDSLFLKKIIKKDWHSIDIGANIGYYSLLLAQLSPQGKIYAFEPVKMAFHLLSLNILINGFNNVITSSKALANRNGYQKFNIMVDTGLSSFKNTGRIKIASKVKVQTITLDSYVEKNKIRRIDFVKIDVEGAEKLVLDGAKRSLRKLKPKIIMIEICSENLMAFGEDGSSIVDFLNNFGYVPYILYENKLNLFRQNVYTRNQNIYFVSRDYCKKVK